MDLKGFFEGKIKGVSRGTPSLCLHIAFLGDRAGWARGFDLANACLAKEW